MPNKTICSIIAVVIITTCLIFTTGDPNLIYFGLAIIAALGGISIWRNHINKP